MCTRVLHGLAGWEHQEELLAQGIFPIPAVEVGTRVGSCLSRLDLDISSFLDFRP